MPRPRIPDRRERILDAAEALVLEHGFDATTVQAVAARASVGKGAVYLEFDGKTSLLDALLRRGTERMAAAVRDRLGDSPARLSTAYRVGAEVLLDDPLMSAAFLDDADVLGAHVRTVTDGRYHARHREVRAWIRDLVRAGGLSPEVEPDALALMLSSTTIGLLSAARLLGPLTPEDLRAALGTLESLLAHLEPPT